MKELNYKVIINEGQGFTQIEKHFTDIKKATDYVASKLNLKLDDEQLDNLKSSCYYSSCCLREQKKKEYNNQMAKDGFIILTGDEKELSGRKCEYVKDNRGDMFGNINKGKGTLKWIDNESRLFLFPPRCTRSGYYVGNVSNPLFIKLI